MRLIDADHLKDRIEKYQRQVVIPYGVRKKTAYMNGFNDGVKYALQMMRAEPTAYDTHKVFEELHANAFTFTPIGFELEAVDLEKALKIVKGGFTNE